MTQRNRSRKRRPRWSLARSSSSRRFVQIRMFEARRSAHTRNGGYRALHPSIDGPTAGGKSPGGVGDSTSDPSRLGIRSRAQLWHERKPSADERELRVPELMSCRSAAEPRNEATPHHVGRARKSSGRDDGSCRRDWTLHAPFQAFLPALRGTAPTGHRGARVAPLPRRGVPFGVFGRFEFG